MSQSASPQEALLSWFAENQRDLPWRHEYHPYQVWISEIMLQQTQMDRVTIFFRRWMEEFPDLKTLAAASEHRVLKYWEGLGYYSRARNILKTAQILTSEHQGKIPGDRKLLRSLPGIGPYTAGAIASIAYNRDVPVVDANIERILARLLNIDLVPGSPEAKKSSGARQKNFFQQVRPGTSIRPSWNWVPWSVVQKIPSVLPVP